MVYTKGTMLTPIEVVGAAKEDTIYTMSVMLFLNLPLSSSFSGTDSTSRATLLLANGTKIELKAKKQITANKVAGITGIFDLPSHYVPLLQGISITSVRMIYYLNNDPTHYDFNLNPKKQRKLKDIFNCLNIP